MKAENTTAAGRDTGKAGEDYVARLLEQKGYRILERNFHSRFGEIDIIAENGRYLAFVEVKTREQGSMVSPFEAITPGKQQKIVKTAMHYLAARSFSLQPRFDAAAVETAGGEIRGAEYLENIIVL